MDARIAGLVVMMTIAGAASAGPPRSVPACAPGDPRIPVQQWHPQFNAKDDVTNAPTFEDGDTVFVEFSRDNTLAQCAGAGADKLYSISVPDKVTAPMDGGLAVNLRGNVQFANGTCSFSGFFTDERVAGIHQGWVETYLRPLAAQEVVTSGKFCMAPVVKRPVKR